MDTTITIATEAIQVLTPQQAWHYMVLPYELQNGTAKMYVSDDCLCAGLSDELEVLLGKRVLLAPMEPAVLRKELGKHYRQPNNGQSTQKVRQVELGNDFVANLFNEAWELRCSDIHLEPYEYRCRLRFRIDGVLVERYVIQQSDYPSLVNKIKIQANLDIAEKRRPQDGRIFLKLNEGKLDVRVSVLPTLHGEKIVLRLLGSDASHLQLTQLGFEENDLNTYLDGIRRPNGMVLISGPTGSGKTTTLYGTLQLLNKTDRNVLTIEDPIEYTLEGINQVQLKESIGLDFPDAMRAFLRQDPDIIMVGEIRDQATASMAIRASLTGHLVLSTIHTNWSWGIVARLLDMNIPPYLLADTLNTAVAQRLVRLLCPHCKEAIKATSVRYPPRFRPPRSLLACYAARGCNLCFYTGYRGRRAIYEVISIDSELALCIKDGAAEIMPMLRSKGFKSLSERAFGLLEEGLTTIDEVYPVLAGG